MTEPAFIAIGSNIEPEKHLPLSLARLTQLGELLRYSGVYQCPAIGPTPQPDFLNAAALVQTRLPPTEIREQLRRIEADLGRIRTSDKYAPRTTDLDLCLLGSLVLETPELVLPDPELLIRPHLAIPMAELDPSFVHPLSGETLEAIARRLLPEASLMARPDVAITITRP